MSAAVSSPYAFTVGGETFYDPHPGAQLSLVQQVARRVLTGEGPSKFFLRGNRGGGKSLTVRRGLCHALAMAIPGFRYVVVRRNYPDLESNHLQFVGSEMRKLGGEWNETKRQARYENGSVGFYRQCEDFGDVEKIVGAEAALLFVDEAPQIEWDNISLMMPSLRVAKVNGVQPYFVASVLSGNPTGTSIDDLDARFVEKGLDDPRYDPADWCHVPIFLKDNPSVDPDEYLKQLGQIPEAYRAAWIDGVRMDARTLFDIHKTKDGKPYHYISELPRVGDVPLLRVPWIQVYRAFDMGYFPDPAVCVWFAVMGKRVFAVHEETWFKTEAHELAAKIRQVTKELIGTEDCAGTFVDPQIAVREGVVTVMDTLEMNGVPCEPSVNDRVLYADAIHQLLGQEVAPGVPLFQIHETGCPMLAKYLPKYRWDEKNTRKMADHKFDHYGVVLAYFAISSGVLSVTQEEPRQQQEAIGLAWLREDRGTRRRVH